MAAFGSGLAEPLGALLAYFVLSPVLDVYKRQAKSLSKEDVIEIEGIVREAMPNAIFKVEMLSEDKNLSLIHI